MDADGLRRTIESQRLEIASLQKRIHEMIVRRKAKDNATEPDIRSREIREGDAKSKRA